MNGQRYITGLLGGLLACGLLAMVVTAGCGWSYQRLGPAAEPAPAGPAQPSSASVGPAPPQPAPVVLAPPPSASVGFAAPQPRLPSVVEAGSRTLRLEYALPGRANPPTSVSWENITIVDDAGQSCPIRNVNMGRSNDGFWTSISFTCTKQARKIAASFTLTTDNASYPLAATLSRVDATHWRVDYGVLPGEK